ncbi:3-dehydroquinate dehydratase (3-dehydroquinase) [Borealophlyctis nickersoniae]|nr:3-dehydroquinate dehydratase (3-dehydroquinase) [Borealophlyctis nickersoniae]
MAQYEHYPAGVTKVSILRQETIIVGNKFTHHLVKDVLQAVPASNYIIITDKNVAKFHLQPLLDAFNKGIDEASSETRPKVLHYVLPPGESVKTREVKAQLEDWVLENKCTRDSCFLALGGGVIGDMIGFVAATFMRGVPIIQIPTTLLAMVDSAIGGKTAVDTPHGKNLIGAFHQPKRIFIDLQYLRTLPRREFVNGLAEVIKTAAIWDADDFELLENHPEKILALSGSSGDEDPESAALLLRVILGSARVKAHVVTVDEKEGGLRGLLNFGHSIGHAIEAILSPQLLHGECVSMGMVREAEIARHLGYLNDVAVGRLVRCLQAYGLPISVEDKRVRDLAPQKKCPVEQLLDIMRVDKKNQGAKKRIVMLSAIGKTHEPRASVIADDVIRRILAPAQQIVPPSKKVDVKLSVPGSKSISNRALVMAALGEGTCRLHGLLHSDDVQVMLDALQKLVGITFKWENNGEILVVTGGGGRLRVPSSEIYLGNAGTASRFLTSVCALIPQAGPDGKGTIVTGNPRMKQRPIGPLVDALRANGVQMRYLEKEGSLPLDITPNGSGLPGGTIKLAASVSSQYVSSILISAPYAANPVTLDLTGEHVISQPYIDMTISMMQSFGINVERIPGTNMYKIPTGVYKNPENYMIEADASSATYPLAYAAITGSRVTVTNIGSKSLQGDAEFAVKVLGAMGATVEQTETTTTVQGPAQLRPIPSIHMETMTDAFLTATVLAAVAVDGKSGSKNATQITGIANQRVKECNRIDAMVKQLAKFGVEAIDQPDGIEIHGVDRNKLRTPEGGVYCFDDHRIAMSFSLLGCVMPEGQFATITEKKCVEKTWPGWWDTLHNVLGAGLVAADVEAPEARAHAKADASGAKSSDGTPAEGVVSEAELDDATIVLIGMRGAGKTHAGRCAARELKRQFVDMDEYLEKALNTTIPKFLEGKGAEGWKEFRKQETKYLSEVLEKFPRGTVVACGGGIVETEEARTVLKRWAGLEGGKRSGYVLHIKRDIGEVSSYLQQDKTRPMYGEDMTAVWNRRKQWYRECSGHEFVIVASHGAAKSPAQYWSDVEADLIHFLKRVTAKPNGQLPGRVPPPPASSFFVSLTFPNISDAIESLDVISEGATALELRVDLLASTEEEEVGKQVALLRRHSDLPIVYTVRTKGQGGKFGDDDHLARLELLRAGLRWGCEYVDIEVEGPQAELERLIARKGNSWIIGSYHDTKGTAIWEESGHGSALLGNQGASTAAVAVRFRDKYSALHPYSDIIKLIGKATRLEDNFALHKFVREIVPSLGLSSKPLIALNMGSLGQISRALNTFLTPVTHPSLPSAAAPGQLSIAEIHQFRTRLGLLEGKKFYLFGAPIAQSMSPTLHNTGFETLGLPHKYGLCETAEWQKMADVVKSGVADGTFGGASITIPLKEDVVKHGIVQRVTEAAKHISAVNTIIVGKDGVLTGDNTDWLGIRASMSSRLRASPPTAGAPKVGVVIGAGGTARAALYALKNFGVEELRIWNRTQEKASALASEFGAVVVTDLSKVFAQHVNADPTFLVVGTVPSSAQEGGALDVEALFAGKSNASTGVLVEMAYRPRETRLIKAAAKAGWQTVEGIEVLEEQGFEQFERWTGLKAPQKAMRKQTRLMYK